MKKRYKFLKKGHISNYGDMKWRFGKWYQTNSPLEMCKNGFHCSKGIYQAFSYVQGSILCQVEVKGKKIIQRDKEVWEKMRIVKSWKWNKKDRVMFAVYAARLVLPNFEKVFPDDDRPRKAIEAAEQWIKNPTKKNKSAAESVAKSAAESVKWSATKSAEKSAKNAAISAMMSAWSAAKSAAKSAAESAWSAAWSAGSAEKNNIYKQLDKWMLYHLKNLRVLKEEK